MSGTNVGLEKPAAPVTRVGLAIGLLVGSAFVMILNETIMSVALPVLIADLQISASTAQWLTSGFLLTMAVVIPVTGFLLQRFTPRQVFVASMTLFSLGTLIAGLAPGFEVLLTGRIVQAVGTAVMVPLLFTTVMTLVPAERRGSTMGTISIVIAVAPAVGPTISGLILSALDWRWMFWIVLPIALVALVAGASLLQVPVETRKVPLDVPSVLISAIAFSGLVYGLSAIGEAARGGAAVPPWIPIVIGAVAMVVFVARQRRLQRDDRALLDLRPFAHRSFVVSVVLVVLSMMALFGALILLPLYLQEVLGTDPFVTGLVVLPGGLVMGLLGPVVGRTYDRIGARPLVIPGAVVLSAALWLLTALVGGPLWTVVAAHVVLSAGIAVMLTPLMTDALSALPTTLYSHGSAIITTLQQVAGAAGTALFVTVMTLASASGGAIDAAGVRVAFLTAAVISLLAIGTSLLVAPRKAAVE
ncbi:multidrug efflux MFS transporter [Pseudonocardia sp. KRD-184]|uniref:Multidrug efflux MFS transporter n=1 Tax=Pseudonocardia oceani TaxID=2792013 RepID=A0ABS6U700_9PSEU|nr:DHA2 family efflux MFS transporter permease subunit [Pseudonocardia oceani]MBW0092684.1 multidrug efflux MFS transporter [Pseudonocardia oceani]MBW0099514.1 multidrug efflux MFS transporter [Pseudonocardia oceani]MBW0112102.1 multidrug efflux MFS transporter [Pseudonocardia oceani]MBW0125534.1 multidrug efflux MFS transporter [Pseudonocardia oceani]MBW0127679.1 multidrug efflux MFS transporter [Pseudonocardia oceani]